MVSNEKVAKLQDRLDEILKIKKMKAIRLSELTAIPKGTISYYLKGKSTPKADRLKIICETLNVSETWLLGYNVPMERITFKEDKEIASVINLQSLDQKTLIFGVSKSVDILLELKIPEETIKQLILKHFDIRYSEVTAILKNKQ